jgi:hypothetical protein
MAKPVTASLNVAVNGIGDVLVAGEAVDVKVIVGLVVSTIMLLV